MILENLVKHCEDKLVSCKIRLLNHSNISDTLKLIETLESTGINFFSIHLRQRNEPSKFRANWKALYEIRKNAKIPFNANGDIFSPYDVIILKKYNLCDGFLFARGAVHNPKIFDEIINYDYQDSLEYDEEKDYKFLKEDREELFNETQEENNNNKKSQKQDPYEDDVKTSLNLAKTMEDKYKGREIKIIDIIKDYLELAMKTGNNFRNSKYVILYLLKTHKKFIELFQKIQRSNNFGELRYNIILNIL